MHSMFKGTIGFGLVSIPIRLYKAMDEEHVALHWVHRACSTRIRYQKFCPHCKVVVDAPDLAKAASLADGRMVIVPAEDLDGKTAAGGPDHSIGIVGFHRIEEIDPILYRGAYWLKPAEGGGKAYHLLLDCMDQSGLAAIANVALGQKPGLALVRAMEGTTLALHTLYYPESLRREGLQPSPSGSAPSEQERRLALALIQQMSSPFLPEQYPNQPRQQLLERIRRLAEGAARPLPPEDLPEGLLTLMQRLKTSLELDAEEVRR
jgi:DNA end-binding protein Ku